MTDTSPATDAAGGPARRKACSACGTAFTCRPDGCWCGSVTLSDQVREELRERYADCLCPACLAKLSTEQG